MPPVGRVGDNSNVPMDVHGCMACPHTCIGPGIQGSNDVLTNGLPTLRLQDKGVHSPCCGPNDWHAVQGSATVLVNGKPVHRQGDMDQHCGGLGKLIEGSPNVVAGGSPTNVPTPFPVVVITATAPHMEVKFGDSITIRGTPTFVNATVAALERLSQTANGQALLRHIDSNPNPIDIVESTSGNGFSATNHGGAHRSVGAPASSGSGGTIRFNPNRTQIGDGLDPWETRPPMVGLHHELFHAYQAQRGTLTTGTVGTGTFAGTRHTDMEAVGLGPHAGDPMTENALRSELGEPIRPRYFD